MAQVLRGQASVVVFGEVVGSVAVAQTIVWPIPANRLFGVDPLPLQVGNLLERSVPLLDVPNPLVEVGRERLNPAIFAVLGDFPWHEYLTLLDVVVDHIGCFPLGSQPAKYAKDSVAIASAVCPVWSWRIIQAVARSGIPIRRLFAVRP